MIVLAIHSARRTHVEEKFGENVLHQGQGPTVNQVTVYSVVQQ